MISEDVRARIRRLFFAEHWKVGTIAAELGLHRDTVACAVDTSRFSTCRFRDKARILDPYRDFIPVTEAAHGVNVLVVHPSLPVKSVKDLVALARARPGEMNFSSAAPGTMNHLASELFKSMAKVNIVRVSYRGSASAMTAVMSGEVQMMFGAAAPVKPHIQSGRVKALAVSTPARSPAYPELPTVAEAGLPGFEAVSVHGVFVPVKTPDAIVARLQQEIVRVLQRPESKERLASVGVEPVGVSPAPPDFRLIAEAYGLPYGRVTDATGLASSLRAAASLPALIEYFVP